MLSNLFLTLRAFTRPAFLMILLLAACSEDEPTQVATSMALSVPSIAINDDETVKAMLSPKPSGMAAWQIADKPSWLVVTPESGTISAPAELQFSRDKSVKLAAGTYTGELSILSTASGELLVPVTLTIAAKPEIEVSAQTISLAAAESSKSFTIKNTGTGKLNWQISSNKPWAITDATSGFLMDGESKTINVLVDKDTIMAGNQSASLTVTSNALSGGNKVIGLEVVVPEFAYITTAVESLSLNYYEEHQKLKIYNAGNVAYDWSAAFDKTFFTVTPANGALAFRDSVEVTITPVRTGLGTGDFESVLTIENNKSESVAVNATLRNYLEEKWLLTEQVIDAEYDDNHDVIITVNTDLTLRKLNPESKTLTQVSLNKVPTCVSVSTDGSYAVVGHDGMITYVNLTTMAIVDEHTVSCSAIDIVLGTNGYAYVFPKADQWETIRCINLSTGNETQHTGSSIYAGTRGKLHPNGEAIYGANRGLSPSDFEKYDIKSGTAKYLYDSPYHGDYNFSGDIWISEDGTLLFARSGNVFKSSTVQANDMVYAGTIGDNSKWVMAMDHSKEKNRAYAIFTTGEFYDEIPGAVVAAFDGTYLTAKGTIDLPKYMVKDGNVGGTLYNSLGYFGFFNASGTKFYVISKNAAPAANYAVITVNATL